MKKPNEIRVIVIDSENQMIVERVIRNELKEFQNLVGGLIDAVRLDEKNILWVNDEGLLRSENYFFRWNGRLLAGSGVIASDDGKGETVSTTMTESEAKSKIDFCGILKIN